ncbi:unnamed protein product [Closterium sp. Yama58-4]|nr:unnamed protein product [Closterium sp. Yama58-4]
MKWFTKIIRMAMIWILALCSLPFPALLPQGLQFTSATRRLYAVPNAPNRPVPRGGSNARFYALHDADGSFLTSSSPDFPSAARPAYLVAPFHPILPPASVRTSLCQYHDTWSLYSCRSVCYRAIALTYLEYGVPNLSPKLIKKRRIRPYSTAKGFYPKNMTVRVLDKGGCAGGLELRIPMSGKRGSEPEPLVSALHVPQQATDPGAQLRPSLREVQWSEHRAGEDEKPNVPSSEVLRIQTASNHTSWYGSKVAWQHGGTRHRIMETVR